MEVIPNTPPSSFLRAFFSALRDSMLARLGLAMALLALLSFASILMSTVIADSSSGKASAINISGSLRMMSFRILSEAQQPDKRRQVAGSIEQFERRLANLERGQLLAESYSRPALQTFLPRWRAAIDGLKAGSRLRWHLEVDPLEL